MSANELRFADLSKPVLTTALYVGKLSYPQLINRWYSVYREKLEFGRKWANVENALRGAVGGRVDIGSGVCERGPYLP